MSRLPIVLVAALCLASACSALSIDKTPVKVTHRNSGPRYDLEEEVDRSKLTPVSQTAPEASESANSQTESSTNKKQEDGDKEADSADESPIGHISIRRIFLVPMVRPRPEWQEEAGESGPPATRQPSDDSESQERPAMFAKPFWPFMTPSRPSHHMYGADEASRSPSAMRPLFQRGEEKPEREGERESEPQESRPAGDGREHLIDPIQMMLEMMQQAINGQLTPQTQPNSPDLNKEASSRGDAEQPSEERPKMPTELAKPSAANETREDIVEIEGKKFLRKVLINRHVGPNIIFMTKRLMFVPLNETDSASEQPSTPTTSGPSEAPSTTTLAPTTVSEAVSTTTAASEMPTEEDKSSESSVTTTTAAPTTVAATEPTVEQESTTKRSFADRMAEAIGELDRMVEGAGTTTTTTTTTAAPTSTSTTEKLAGSS